MIQSFADKSTERLFNNIPVRKIVNIEKAARRRLKALNAAHSIEDLRNPPGNRLEALKGDRVGQYSIRINDQYRVCFIWEKDVGPSNVEIVDYHR
ncbi:MAG: type II toxin-antitoxin system RelE/ParE family toxin [Ahrensia sp.]|nr:type II toxin-antitoxin system RelE/ParE family toxin [Ahrensia sp.]